MSVVKSLLFSFLALVLLASCSPQIQVVTLRGSNVTPTEEGLILDNDTLTLRHNFASEKGRMAISVVNKLNQPLYVGGKRSSFIVGQNKMDYWHDVADVQLTGSSYSTLYNRYTVGYLEGSISKQDAVGFIPPKPNWRNNNLSFFRMVRFPSRTLLKSDSKKRNG